MYDASAIDVVDALLAHVYLVFAYGAERSDDLSVNIGEAHAVIVDEVYFAHTATHQCFYYISTHAAYAKYGYATAHQGVDGWFAHQELCTRKLILHLSLS